MTRIDPVTGTPKRLAEGYGASSSIAAGKGAVWLGGIAGVNKLDPIAGTELERTFVTGVIDSQATSIAIGRGATWFVGSSSARLWRVAMAGNTVDDSFPVGDGPGAVALDDEGVVWVACIGDGSVSRLDPTRDSPETIDLGVSPGGILFAFRRVWTSPGPPPPEG